MECNPGAIHTNTPVAPTCISPYAIAPPPKASTRPCRKPKARRGFAAVLTSSLYKPHQHTIKKAKAKDIGRHRLKRYPLQVRHKQDWGQGVYPFTTPGCCTA